MCLEKQICGNLGNRENKGRKPGQLRFMMPQNNFVIQPGFPGPDTFKLQGLPRLQKTTHTLGQVAKWIPLNFTIKLFTSPTVFYKTLLKDLQKLQIPKVISPEFTTKYPE